MSEGKTQAYLGDGLYAEFDGFEIILSADRDGVKHWVALEPEVLESFLRFAGRAFGVTILMETIERAEETL